MNSEIKKVQSKPIGHSFVMLFCLS